MNSAKIKNIDGQGVYKPLNLAWFFAGIAAIAGAVWALCGGARPRSSALTPNPRIPSYVIERPPYNADLTRQSIAVFAGRSRADSKDWLSLSMLAEFYLQRCRETGDINDAIRAEQAARRSLSVFKRGNAGAKTVLAMSLLTQHRFGEALAALQWKPEAQLAAHTPQSSETTLLRAEILMEMGDYAGSKHELLNAGPNPAEPNRHALLARLLEIEGQPVRALEELRKAQVLADRNLGLPASSAAWYHMRVGNLCADLGRTKEADAAYREALELFPGDYRTLTSLARLSAGKGDWQAVLTAGRRSAAVVPTPEIVALLGDAYTALGKSEEAKAQYALVDTTAHLAKAQGAIYDRQRALFCADHDRNLDEGLTLARRELTVRRDVYAYDTLAWVCCRKGLKREARAAMNKALQYGTQDARMFYHAGCLALSEGDHAQARDCLSRALALNPYFLPFAPEKARSILAQLDRK